MQPPRPSRLLAIPFAAGIGLLAAAVRAQEFEFAGEASAVELPLRMLTNGNHPGLPCIEVGFGDERALFLLDTGFNAVAVDRRYAQRREFEQRGSDLSLGIGSGGAVPLYRAPALDFGGAAFTAPLFYGMDLHSLSKGRGVSIAGVLGGQFFQRAIVVVDYAAGRVHIVDPEVFEPPTDIEPLRIEGVMGQPEILGTLDDERPLRFVLDTGAEPDLILNAPFAERSGLLRNADRLCPVPITGLDGGVASRLCSIGRLRAGPIAGDDVTTVLLPKVEGLTLGGDARRAGLIGSSLLADRRVTFDYAHRRIFVAAATVPGNCRPTGLSLDWDDPSDVKVMHVMTWPGHDAGDIAVGDRLVDVDHEGMPATANEFRARLLAKTAVVLTLLRDGARHDVTWAHLPTLPRATFEAR